MASVTPMWFARLSDLVVRMGLRFVYFGFFLLGFLSFLVRQRPKFWPSLIGGTKISYFEMSRARKVVE